MTNMQFYIALAVPSVLVILSWLQQDKRLGRLEATMDRMDTRIGTMEHDLRQFYAITGELKGRVDELSRR